MEFPILLRKVPNARPNFGAVRKLFTTRGILDADLGEMIHPVKTAVLDGVDAPAIRHDEGASLIMPTAVDGDSPAFP